MLAEAYSECCRTSKMELFVEIISSFQSLTILAKNSISIFNRVLNQPLGHYAWELVFGRFNSLFQKFIHPLGMFIVECYIFIGYRATESKKEKKSLCVTIIKFVCSPSFDLIEFFNSKQHKWKLRVIFSYIMAPCTQMMMMIMMMMLQGGYACYTTVHVCYFVLLLLP